MPNRVIELYRQHFPDDPRTDDAITLEAATNHPHLLQIPDFMGDYERIQGEIKAAYVPTATETAKSAFGSYANAIAQSLASIPKSAAEIAHEIPILSSYPEAVGAAARAMGMSSAPEPSLEERVPYRIGTAIEEYAASKLPEVHPELEESFWGTKVPRGLGSATGFMAGGVGAKALKVPSWLGVIGMGSAMSSDEMYQDAVRNNATKGQRIGAWMAGLPLGASEIIPLGRMLNRLDKLSGGTFSDTLVAAGKESFEEAAQEAMQGAAGDAVAKYLAAYDPDREMFDSLAEDAGVGGVTGFLFSLITQKIGRRAGTGPTAEVTTTEGDRGAATPVPPSAHYEPTEEEARAAEDLAKRAVDGDESPEFFEAENDLRKNGTAYALYRQEVARIQSEAQREHESDSGGSPAALPAPEPGPEIAPREFRSLQDVFDFLDSKQAELEKILEEPGLDEATRFQVETRLSFIKAARMHVQAQQAAAPAQQPIMLGDRQGIQVPGQVSMDPSLETSLNAARVAATQAPSYTQYQPERMLGPGRVIQAPTPPAIQQVVQAREAAAAEAQQTADKAKAKAKGVMEEALGSVETIVEKLNKRRKNKLSMDDILVPVSDKDTPAIVKAKKEAAAIVANAKDDADKAMARASSVAQRAAEIQSGVAEPTQFDLSEIDTESIDADVAESKRGTTRQKGEKEVSEKETTYPAYLEIGDGTNAGAMLERAAAKGFGEELSDILTRQARVTGMAEQNTKRMTALQGPDGRVYVLGTFRRKPTKESEKPAFEEHLGVYVVNPEEGKYSVPIKKLMDRGYAPIASIRVRTPRKGARYVYEDRASYDAEFSSAGTMVSESKIKSAAAQEELAKQKSPTLQEPEIRIEDEEVAFTIETAGVIYERLEAVAADIEGSKVKSLVDESEVYGVLADVVLAGGTPASEIKELFRTLIVGSSHETVREAVARRIEAAYHQSGTGESFAQALSPKAGPARVTRISDSGPDRKRRAARSATRHSPVDLLVREFEGRDPEGKDRARESVTSYAAALGALRSAGVDVRVLKQKINGMLVEGGRVDQLANGSYAMLLAVADITNPTSRNFLHLFHEAAHVVFFNESVAAREAVQNAIRRAFESGGAGIEGFTPKIDESLSSEEQEAVLQEERLVELAARELVSEGFDAEQSRGVMQAIARWVKDVIYRAIMAVQKAWSGNVSVRTAQAYFANRVRSLLSGDVSMGFIPFIGGPRATAAQEASWHGSTDGAWPGGFTWTVDPETLEIVHQDPLPDSVEAVRATRFRKLEAVADPTTEVSSDVDSRSSVTVKVAAQNVLREAFMRAYGAWTANGNNPAGLSFDEFLVTGNFIKVKNLPSEIIGELNARLEADGFDPVDESLSIDDLQEGTPRDRAAQVALAILGRIRAKLSERATSAEKDIPTLADRIDRLNRRLHKLTRKYDDLDAVLSEVLDGTEDAPGINQLLKDLKQDIRSSVAPTARKSGTLMQVIRELDKKATRPQLRQYEQLIEDLYRRYSTDNARGRKFADMLDAVATLGIDWRNETAANIRETINTAASGNILLEPLTDPEMNGTALVTMIIGFGRRNAHVMDMLQLKRSRAFEERAEVNAALAEALAGTRESIDRARRMIQRLPKLAKAGERILAEIERHHDVSRKLHDELVRDRAFLDFHHDTHEILRQESEKLEAILKFQKFDWEPHHGAKYVVPPAPGALISVLESGNHEKTLDLNNLDVSAIKEDIRKMSAWMANVPENRRGSWYHTIKQMRDKLIALEAESYYEGEKGWEQSIAVKILGPITDKLKFIGTPLGRNLARRFEQMAFWQHSLGRPASAAGKKWQAAEGAAMNALGINRQDVFRERFWRPAMGYIEKRQDILVGSPSPDEAVNRVLSELRSHLSSDPSNAALLSRPGAWRALENLYRLSAHNSTLLNKNRSEMGIKVQDDKLGGFRESIGVAPFTIIRSTSPDLERIWKSMRDEWVDPETKLSRSNIERLMEEADDPEAALMEFIATKFTPDVMRDFVRPLVYRPGRSAFYGTKRENGAMTLAARENVIQAFEASGGDMVAFVSNLYELEGADGSLSEFTAETLSTFQNFFNVVHGLMREREAAKKNNAPIPSHYMMDARRSEEFPPEWLNYMPYDVHSMRQVVKLQTYEKAFGRDMEGYFLDMEAAKAEQRDLLNQWIKIGSLFPDLKKSKLREAMRREARSQGLDPVSLENASDNLNILTRAEGTFTAMIKLHEHNPPEIQPFAEIFGAMAGATVQGGGTALIDTISIFEQPFRKMGLNTSAVKKAFSTVGSLANTVMGSLYQAIGWQVHGEAEHNRMLTELGIFDDDATLTLKEKMASVYREQATENRILRPAVFAARAIKTLTSSGFGRAIEGAPIFPTLKIQAPFTWMAQNVHAAIIKSDWKYFEKLTAKAVDHFRRNESDRINAGFIFDPSQLGYRHGSREWNYVRETLARYGLSIEGMARDAYDRRLSNPSAPMLSKEAYQALAIHGQNETTLETGFASRPPGFMTNPVLVAANPLLGWAIQKGYDTWRAFREPNGRFAWKAVRSGLYAYAAILPVGLFYAFLRDEYDEEIVGKKQNVMELGSDNVFLAMLDNFSRVGTFGIFGEFANSTLNMDTQKEFSVDNRVFFLNSLMAIQRSIGTWIRQGTADWATVYRPLAMAMGGGGYLQNADILINAASLDNQEARVMRRINVNNYLRTAGRTQNLDVRHGARGFSALANPIKPYIGQMGLAAYANDATTFRDAWRNAILAARAEGKEDPEDHVRRSFESYHPLALVFRTKPSEGEVMRLLRAMDDDGQVAVREALRLYNRYITQIGGNPSMGKKDRTSSKSSVAGVNLPGLNDIRRMVAVPDFSVR